MTTRKYFSAAYLTGFGTLLALRMIYDSDWIALAFIAFSLPASLVMLMIAFPLFGLFTATDLPEWLGTTIYLVIWVGLVCTQLWFFNWLAKELSRSRKASRPQT